MTDKDEEESESSSSSSEESVSSPSSSEEIESSSSLSEEDNEEHRPKSLLLTAWTRYLRQVSLPRAHSRLPGDIFEKCVRQMKWDISFSTQWSSPHFGIVNAECAHDYIIPLSPVTDTERKRILASGRKTALLSIEENEMEGKKRKQLTLSLRIKLPKLDGKTRNPERACALQCYSGIENGFYASIDELPKKPLSPNFDFGMGFTVYGWGSSDSPSIINKRFSFDTNRGTKADWKSEACLHCGNMHYRLLSFEDEVELNDEFCGKTSAFEDTIGEL